MRMSALTRIGVLVPIASSSSPRRMVSPMVDERKYIFAMYVTRAAGRPRCTAWRSLFSLVFQPSSLPHRGSPTVGRRKQSGTSWIPTPAHAPPHLSSIPLHVDGTACSLMTPTGVTSTLRFLPYPVGPFLSRPRLAPGPADRPADRVTRSACLPQFPVPLACTPAEPGSFRTALFVTQPRRGLPESGPADGGPSRGLGAEFIEAIASTPSHGSAT